MFLMPVSRAQGAGLSESLRGLGDAAWGNLSLFKPALPRRRTLWQEKGGDLAAAEIGAKVLHISGYVNLTGTGYAGQGGFVTVTMTGWTTLRDENGPIGGLVRFTTTDSYFASGNFVSGWTRPYAYVTVFENGRRLGTVRVEGSINVSGWVNGGWANLSGAGTVSGTLYAVDPAKK